MASVCATLRGVRTSRGFSLIEALIAMVVLLLAVLAMLSVVPFGFTNVQTNSIDVQAVAVAQQALDDEHNALLHALPMPAATTVPIDPGQSYLAGANQNSNYGSFTVTPNGCSSVQLTGSLLSGVNTYSCSATVAWTESGATRQVTVQSYVTK
jgi:Tfp pilus assembly protein PilV